MKDNHIENDLLIMKITFKNKFSNLYKLIMLSKKILISH